MLETPGLVNVSTPKTLTPKQVAAGFGRTTHPLKNNTIPMTERARQLIDTLELIPHPEGGYFKEVYRSPTLVHSPIAEATRNGLTDIYFLLLAGQISRFHRVLHDEIWHFYEGAPLTLIAIEPPELTMEEIRLASGGDVPRYKHCIRGGTWQAAFTTGDYTLVGCTVAPGFAFADFEFLAQESTVQSAILDKYPALRHLL